MFVYSAISWEEILVLPILRACVSTWRYRDRRAATPTFKRSATRPPSCQLDFVTAVSVVPGRLRVRLCNCPAQRVRVDVVDEAPAAVDLDDGDPLPVRSLELGIAVDRYFSQLETQLGLGRIDDASRRRAEMAARRGEEGDFGYG